MTSGLKISTASISQQSVSQIKSSQITMNLLNAQLSTQKKSLDLTDYDAADVKRLFDLRGLVTKRESYLDAINSVETRMNVYELSLKNLSDVVDQGLRLIQNAPVTPGDQLQAISSLSQTYMREVRYSLNQQVEDRFIFSGTRFNQEPVQDITALPVPPVEPFPYTVTNPTLPVYDMQAPGASAPSYATDTVTIEDGFPIDYGISSNELPIQQVVQGLRWLYAATQDLPNYQTYVGRARDLLTQAQSGVRQLRADNSAYLGTLTETKEAHNRLISDLKAQADDIMRVDINEVSAKITFFQTAVQASFAATGRLAKLTITDYL